jgi:hypothetical protein
VNRKVLCRFKVIPSKFCPGIRLEYLKKTTKVLKIGNDWAEFRGICFPV